ncbi:hypothetical protein NDQ71_03655 [Pseudoalteromonas sp. KG3]|uniref:hypothetical protein n=1 Tax=Pseudoalteromonas sp. KG3 TaxID=2951137 RepID=UPI0026595A05|nr:hypothetical protein [Pseudoalteromonas sp. KG3]WKD24203.1 hypothetical protein NDQ71_03655 [Pseudoalteromonas sp. KG3]
MKNNTTVPTTYIPLEKFHIVPITGLTPENLKYSAKKTIRDREKIPHTTKLNILAKSLGIKGGFANYEKEFEEKLKPFMAKHDLHKRVNLLEHKHRGMQLGYTQFTHQQVSERLFYSKGPMPSKLFTGHDFDFSGVLAWDMIELNNALEIDSDWESIITNDIHLKVFRDGYDTTQLNERQQQLLSQGLSAKIAFRVVDKSSLPSFIDFITNGKAKDATPTAVKHKEIVTTAAELILVKNHNTVPSCYNLLGDNLCDTYCYGPDSEVEVYFEEGTLESEIELIKKQMDFFSQALNERLQACDYGWVNVIPYNENLIFLSDNSGNYDFVIKNQRDKVFTHQIYGDYLKRADIPSFIEDYRFKRWEYFNYKGNRELDSHLAEQHYYANGGLTKNYPGQHAILQNYYETSGDYITESRSSNKRLHGFKKIKLAEKELMVSELITIDEINDFLHKNHEYFATRKGDSLPPLNSECDKGLAATCTFYDVLAYISWAEKETNVPLRLLAYDEYLAVRDNEVGKSAHSNKGSDMTFHTPDGRQYPGHPPYMNESDFDALTLRFPESLTNFEKNGLEFIDSNFFAEWLLEGVSIRSASLTSFYDDANVLRASGPRDCTGKYKGIKTGFRLCYELSK